jgi:hypothetical protein
MMLSSLPSARNGAGRTRTADLPLHARLFGEHGTIFYLATGVFVAAMSALVVSSVLYAPRHTPQALGLLALSIFILISGSPSRRIQALALAIMGGLICSHLEPGPLLVAVAAVATGLVNYVCASAVNRELAALTGLTRRERRPVLARLAMAVVVSWGTVTAPGALVVFRYLLERGLREDTAGLLIGAGVGLLAVLVYRGLRDQIPDPAEG